MSKPQSAKLTTVIVVTTCATALLIFNYIFLIKESYQFRDIEQKHTLSAVVFQQTLAHYRKLVRLKTIDSQVAQQIFQQLFQCLNQLQQLNQHHAPIQKLKASLSSYQDTYEKIEQEPGSSKSSERMLIQQQLAYKFYEIKESIEKYYSQKYTQYYNQLQTLVGVISFVLLLVMFLFWLLFGLLKRRIAFADNQKIISEFPEKNKDPTFALNKELQVIYANPAAHQVAQKFSCVDPIELINTILQKKAIKAFTTQKHEFKFKELIYSGTFVWLDELERYHVFLKDISLRKQAEGELQNLAYFDQLTHLPNYNGLYKEFPALLKWSKSFAIIEISNFDNIISLMGKKKSAHVITQFVKLVRKKLSDEKTKIFRVDSTLFGLMIFNDGHQETINQLISSFKVPFKVEGYDIYLTLSIGLVNIPKGAHSTEQLYNQALHALDFARHHRETGFQIYQDSLEEESHRKESMEENLRHAIKDMEFELFYQPKLSIVTGEIISTEVLIRWCRNGEEWISPEDFIPMAEAIGLIMPLGSWILKNACKEAKKWQDQIAHPIPVAVNISAKQLLHEGFSESFIEALDYSELSAQYLELELTETIAMHELQSVQGILSHVKGLGVRISLDDFGTGYSSLSYLNKLPIDYLKIDRSFISDLQINHSDKSIAHGIIQLGKALNMPVIAEGVETKNQLDVLLNWGCQYIQGYYFAQPMTATNLLQFLQKHDSKKWQLSM